jgi:hypothetical protein
MDEKVTCPVCDAEFPMEDAIKQNLEKHKKKIGDEERQKNKENLEKFKQTLRDETEEKNKTNLNKIKELEEKNKKIDEDRKAEIKKAVDADRASNKEHYEGLLENEIKKDREDQLNKHSEEKNKWDLEKTRLNKQIQTLNQTANQGTTVDQGSGAEISLGDYLKKIFKDKSDKIKEYAKGVPGGDWLHEVIEDDRTVCKILYERKNTKNWSNDWKKKLQSDMKDSKSDIGIIFTRSTPKDFPKDASWYHEGNIFICKYDFPTLKNLATTQRWAHVLINKQRGDKKENAVSAIEFLDGPIVKNLIMQKINISEKKRKKMKLTLQNLNDAIDLDEQMDDSLEEFFKEIEKIGISAFLDKWNK